MAAVEKNVYPSITLFIHPSIRLSLCWKLELGTLEDESVCVCERERERCSEKGKLLHPCAVHG